MALPSITSSLSDINAALAHYQSQRLEAESQIGSIHNELMEQELKEIRLPTLQREVVRALLGMPTADRTADVAKNSLKTAFIREKNQVLQNYKEVLEAREAYTEDGQRKDLTAKTKRELMQSFSQRVDLIIAQVEQTMVTLLSSPLEPLLDQMGRDIQQAMEYYEKRFAEKISLTEKMYEKDVSVKQLTREKQEILEAGRLGQSTHPWEACVMGGDKGLEFLQTFSRNHSDWDTNQLHPVDGESCLHCAVAYQHLPIVEYLLSRPSTSPYVVNARGYQPIHFAAKTGNVEIAKQLLAHMKKPLTGKAEILSPLGERDRTPLHISVFEGHVEMTRWLLKHKVNINARTSEKVTPLHNAVFTRRLPVVLLLVKNGNVDVNIEDANRQTPLYYAVQQNFPIAAALILGHPSFAISPDPVAPSHPTQLRKLVEGLPSFDRAIFEQMFSIL